MGPADAPPLPAISALVLAHDRRDFLPVAVRSVLNQTLPSEEMELVIVHTGASFPLDSPRPDLRIRLIPTEKRTIGEKLALGIAECRGRAVAVLEDDDVWAPTKLARVAEAFHQHPNLGFYHNDFVVWHASDPAAPTPPELGSVGPSGTHFADRYRPSTLPVRAARRILRYGGLLNASSISVRRDLLLPSLETLTRATASPELGLFVPAVQADALLQFDGTILTGYRRHARAMTAITPGGLDETLRTVGDRATRAIPEYRSVESQISHSGAKELVRFLTFSLEIRSVVASVPPNRR
ncbi:MAG: glycosyltransferase family 2 protein, partial [Thermoplasmata archaeon]|nr:glycosyltransferase family 2 protein [Thermoplasmata archaeon]